MPDLKINNQLSKTSKIKPVLKYLGVGVLIVILIAIVLFAGGIFYKPTEKPAGEQEKVEQPNIIPKVISSAEGKLPKDFPKDLPLYGQTKILKSYTLDYPDSDQIQGVYKFYSSKTMEEIFSFYKNWGEKNGWKALDTVQKSNYQAVFLGKEKQSMGVKIYKEAQNVLVDLEVLK